MKKTPAAGECFLHFSVRSFLSLCNRLLRLHHLLYDIKHALFFVLYSDKTWAFDQSERALVPIYIIKQNRTQSRLLYLTNTITIVI